MPESSLCGSLSSLRCSSVRTDSISFKCFFNFAVMKESKLTVNEHFYFGGSKLVSILIKEDIQEHLKGKVNA